MIEVDGLWKKYGPNTVLQEISFQARDGELVTLLGPSGCGKTTTLRCIAGFVLADSGTISSGGRDITGVPPNKRGFGMVFQSYALFPHMTVAENVAFGLRVRGVRKAELKDRVRRALELVRLHDLGGRLPTQLSGGQQQRVALARAVSYEPKTLLLDEPLSNLDAALRVEMRSEIRQLQKSLGLTAVYVTHDQEEALNISDRVIIMKGGRIEQIAEPWDIYHRPATPFAATFVGTANVIPGHYENGMICISGNILIDYSAERPSGPVWLVIRPENVRVLPEGGIPGSVRAVTLLGANQRLEVEVGYDLRLLVDLPASNYPAHRPGERVGLSVNAERATMLSRDPLEAPPRDTVRGAGQTGDLKTS